MASSTPCRAGPDTHFYSGAIREKGGSLSRGIETERSEEARSFFFVTTVCSAPDTRESARFVAAPRLDMLPEVLGELLVLVLGK